EPPLGLQVQQCFLDRAQRHGAIHRILGQRISFDIERLTAAKHETIVMRLVAVPVYKNDISRTHDGLDRDLVGGRGAVGSEEELLTTKGPCCLVLGSLDIASRFEKRIQTTGRSRRFSHENVGPVEVTEVADPMGVEDGLASGYWKRVKRADRTARVVFQVIEV